MVVLSSSSVVGRGGIAAVPTARLTTHDSPVARIFFCEQFTLGSAALHPFENANSKENPAMTTLKNVFRTLFAPALTALSLSALAFASGCAGADGSDAGAEDAPVAVDGAAVEPQGISINLSLGCSRKGGIWFPEEQLCKTESAVCKASGGWYWKGLCYEIGSPAQKAAICHKNGMLFIPDGKINATADGVGVHCEPSPDWNSGFNDPTNKTGVLPFCDTNGCHQYP
jgi:hypothetical protein